MLTQVSRLVHLQCEEESASSAWAIGMHADLAIGHLNDAFDNGQPQSNAFMVYFGGPLHLAKAREELRQFIL